jgi:hypothetical protein
MLKKKENVVKEISKAHGTAIKSHVEPEVRDICAYCGREFVHGEVVVRREVNGRRWRFCSEACYQDFLDAIHFRDEDLDAYGEEGNVTVGGEEKEGG